MASRLLLWKWKRIILGFRLYFQRLYVKYDCGSRTVLSTKYAPVLLAANAIRNVSETNDKTKFQNAVDPSTLSHSYLVRNASSVTVDSVCCLINQTTAALISSEKEYAKAIYALIKLLDYQTDIRGSPGDEEILWDLIIQQKASVSDLKHQRSELEIAMVAVEKLVAAAAETAFAVGADSLAIMLNEHMSSARAQLVPYKDVTMQAEKDLTDAQVRDVQSTIIEEDNAS